MTNCLNAACTRTGKPKFCSRQCSATYWAAARRDSGYYAAIGKRGNAARRAKGKDSFLRASEVSLMAQGRYKEAARMIYCRGYDSGWTAGRRGNRQMPAKGAA